MNSFVSSMWMLLAVVALVGCGKKADSPAPAAPSEVQITENIPLTEAALADHVEYSYQSNNCKVAVYGDAVEEAPTALSKGLYKISRLNFDENNGENVFIQFGPEGKRHAYILCSHPKKEDERLSNAKTINDQFEGKIRIK